MFVLLKLTSLYEESFDLKISIIFINGIFFVDREVLTEVELELIESAVSLISCLSMRRDMTGVLGGVISVFSLFSSITNTSFVLSIQPHIYSVSVAYFFLFFLLLVFH